jgi:hypothetical protein
MCNDPNSITCPKRVVRAVKNGAIFLVAFAVFDGKDILPTVTGGILPLAAALWIIDFQDSPYKHVAVTAAALRVKKQ